MLCSVVCSTLPRNTDHPSAWKSHVHTTHRTVVDSHYMFIIYTREPSIPSCMYNDLPYQAACTMTKYLEESGPVWHGKVTKEQECIPVGCIQSAAVDVSGGCLPGGGCFCPGRVSARGGVCLGGCLPWEGVYPGGGLTDTTYWTE